MSLAARSDQPELMDADDLSPETYAAVVGDLAKVNTVTLAARPTMAFVKRIAAGRPSLRLLDVGFGDGDMLRRIARWAGRHGVAAELVGVDLNPRSRPAAEAHTDPALMIRYETGDYLDMGDGWDAVISSLVAHHMTREQLVRFLRWMEASAHHWLVNDLHRHGVAHQGYPLLATLARWHPIVRHDGRVSIARSFRPAEWPPLLAEAGVTDARVYRAFPFRLCVERTR
jgi:2-polyprenyl-3-methyl-5-hydroxy-6-metoxy-1,4-benzoquinol methylase